MKLLRFFVVSLIVPMLFSTIVEFYYSKYCPHCQRMEPILDELKEKYNFTLIKICIEDKRDEWVEMLKRTGLDDCIIKIGDIYLSVGVGTPTMIIDGKYIMIGEFYSNLKECINYGNFSLCPSSKDLFLDMIQGKNVKEISGKRLCWFDFNEIVNKFGKENCKMIQVNSLPTVKCEKNNENIIFMESFLYFLLREHNIDIKGVFGLKKEGKNISFELPITKVQENTSLKMFIIIGILGIFILAPIAWRLLKWIGKS